MVRIQRLRRPNKRSGYLLAPGKNTKVRGLYIVNQNKFPIFVDKYTRSPVKKSRRKK